MTDEQIKLIAQKIENGTATKQEELFFLQELNKVADAIRNSVHSQEGTL